MATRNVRASTSGTHGAQLLGVRVLDDAARHEGVEGPGEAGSRRGAGQDVGDACAARRLVEDRALHHRQGHARVVERRLACGAQLAPAVAQGLEQTRLVGIDPNALEEQPMRREVQAQVLGHRVVRLVEAHLPARPVEERQDDRLDLVGHELAELVLGDQARTHQDLSDAALRRPISRR